MQQILERLIKKVEVQKKRALGVGIDIENIRPLKYDVSKYLINNNDANLIDLNEVDILTIWTIKEALFKATPNNEGLVLRDFTIKTLKNYIGTASCERYTQYNYFFETASREDYVNSIAVCILK